MRVVNPIRMIRIVVWYSLLLVLAGVSTYESWSIHGNMYSEKFPRGQFPCSSGFNANYDLWRDIFVIELYLTHTSHQLRRTEVSSGLVTLLKIIDPSFQQRIVMLTKDMAKLNWKSSQTKAFSPCSYKWVQLTGRHSFCLHCMDDSKTLVS